MMNQILPEEARRNLESGEWTYLDVRTPAEFAAGRPKGAINIPVAEVNPRTGRMEFNPRFLTVLQAIVAKEANVIVACKSGSRSSAAVELMQQAGYSAARNMIGGFSGVVDPSGAVVQDGWVTLGFPVERGEAAQQGYAALSLKASGA